MASLNSPLANEVKNAGSISRRVQRVLVTGGAGFVGSHLCDRLIALGHEV
jgi:FlaA1/EpsC-like NDP-sugar epimerase